MTGPVFVLAAQAGTEDDNLLGRIADEFRSYLETVGINPFFIVAVFAGFIVAVIAYRLLRPAVLARQEIEKLFQALTKANGLTVDEEQELRAGVAALGLENPIVIFTRRSLLDRHAETVISTETEPRRSHRLERLRQVAEKLYA
jgi:hypothetical protein